MSDVVETAEEFIEELPEVTQGGYGLGVVLGVGAISAGIGAAAAYFLSKRQLQKKYAELAAEEVAGMRETYHAKTIALENTVDKPALAEIIKEQGYSTEPPMAVTPPDAVVEAAEAAQEEEGDPRPEAAEVAKNVFKEPKVTQEDLGMPLVEDTWNDEKERARRSVHRPYVIHRDEVHENEDYDTTTYTYYEEDDVLCNERDEVISKEDRDDLVGEGNLNQFGHGSNDASIVYVRNDRLEMQMEIVRSPNSYAEEVHGFRHADYTPPRRRGRESADDE
jgi:hypothetical protein